MTKSIIFDLDGTLIDTAPDLINSLNHTISRENCPPLAYELGRNCIGMGARNMIKHGLDIHDIRVSEQRLDQLFCLFIEHYKDNIAVESQPFESAISSVEKFLSNDWKVAICTNKLERLATSLLKALKIADRFEVLTGGDTFGVGKPDPLPILKTMELLGASKEFTVMVGDSRPDIEGAQNAGIMSIAVDFGYTSESVSAFGPDRIISHFDQLWDAVYELQPKFSN